MYLEKQTTNRICWIKKLPTESRIYTLTLEQFSARIEIILILIFFFKQQQKQQMLENNCPKNLQKLYIEYLKPIWV